MINFHKENYYKEKLKTYTKKCKIFSIIRAILAINFIIWMIYFISDIKTINMIVTIISFIGLISFMLFTNKFYKIENDIKKILNCYEKHYYRRNYDFNALIDDGSDFLLKDNYKLSDLDIFGKKSLYQYICQAKTKLGRIKLAKQLDEPLDKPLGFTNSIIELGNSEEAILIESAINDLDNSERKYDHKDFNNLFSAKIKFPKYKIIINLLSVINSYIILVLSLFNVVDISVFFMLLISNIITSFLLKCDQFSIESTKYYNLCDKYINIIESISNVKYEEEYLKNISNKAIKCENDLKKLKRIFLKLSTRRNFIAKILLNSILPYDYIISLLYNLEFENINGLEELFDSISEFELILSFSNIVKDTNQYTIGTISNEIKIDGIVHPLVQNCVENDYQQVGGVILTGSNMSGKTTFMRTLGINQVLFNACKIVCAKSYYAPNLKVFTSLRASDELSEGVSTFYAEILRMKLINEEIKNNKCLILIDEIFKGTNANDRIKASLMVIDKLNLYNQFFIISTHDFELCDSKNIVNYHFNENYVDNKIYFDYKIKIGKCDTKNAIYLLRMANIIE